MNSRWFALTTLALLLLVSAAHVLAAPSCKGGQFRDTSGATVVEGATVLILLYPLRDAHADRKIDAIRREYRQRFEQQSVLRADSVSRVSF